jgi:hypothetical protein
VLVARRRVTGAADRSLATTHRARCGVDVFGPCRGGATVPS